jgi:hypothetical protein
MILDKSITGIPQEMWNDLSNFIINGRVVNDLLLNRKLVKETLKVPNPKWTGRYLTQTKYVWKDGFVSSSNQIHSPSYLLNLVSMYINDYGYVVTGKNDNGHWQLYRSEISWQLPDGTTHTENEKLITIVVDGMDVMFDDVENKNQWSFNWIVNGKTTVLEYDVSEIADIMKVSEDTVLQMQNDFFHGDYYEEQDKYITNIFPSLEWDGNLLRGTFFVNEKEWNTFNYSQLRTCYGTAQGDFRISWTLYNGCERPDNAIDADSTGNFGECWKSGYLTKENPESFVLDINSLADIDYTTNAHIKFTVHFLPLTGKEFRLEIYANLKTKKISLSPFA